MNAPQQLTVDTALQQAITHHQSGRLQEAEQLYRAILQALPAQADANHNLGLIACQVGQHAAGLPYLKMAYSANPVHPQFVLSYAEALLATGKAQEAFPILQGAILRGLNTAVAQSLLQRIVAALPGGTPPTVQSKPATTADINQLIALYQGGQHAMLEITANELLARDPKCGMAWKILGAALQLMGKDSCLHAMKMAAQLLPKDAEAHGNLGIALRNFGHLQESLVSCRQAVKLNPNSANAHNGLGLTLRDLGQLDEAVAAYRRAVKLQADYVEAYCNLGDALRDLHKYDEARVNYRKAIDRQPRYALAHEHMGDVLRDLGQLEEAVISYRRALELDVDSVTACNSLALTLQLLDRSDDALAMYQCALQIKPDFAETHVNLANLLLHLHKFADAEASFRKAIEFKPDFVAAHTNLGNLLREIGRQEESIVCYRQALSFKPDFAIAHNNLGNTLRDIGDLDGALASFRQALTFDANSVEALNNLGNVLWECGQLDEALQSLRHALQINPQFASAYSNLGNVLLDCRQLGEAIASHRQAIARLPDFAGVYDNLLMTLQYESKLSRQHLFDAHREFGERFALPLKGQWQTGSYNRDPSKRLKIGYVSGDFRKHAVAFFIEPVFVNRDTSQVEIFCYSNSATHDAVTDRLIAATDHWRPCFGMTDEQLAQQIHADGIDILVDLSGHSFRNRLLAFARKPAPVQVTYLGYPSGTGLAAVDYRLTDHYAEPEAGTDPADRYYTEKLFRLPNSLWCYQPSSDMPEVTALPALTNGYLTFGSFNNVNKISSDCIALWSTLLHSLPTSRLVMVTVPEGAVRANLAAQFAEQGIDLARISFYGKLPAPEFQRQLQQMDITLDPLPVNGATTTCESLWLGVPVLTLVGERFLSRAGLSVLSAAQMTEFAAATPAQFVDIAIALANDLPRLAAIRAGLRERLRGSALLDQQLYTRNLEHAYRQMWRDYLAQ